MKKMMIALACIFTSSPALAENTNSYMPFRYETPCYLVNGDQTSYQEDTCVVIETREKGGALRSRNIFSNKFQLTIKSRFDKERGFVTWDSHNKFEYKWEYKVGTVNGLGARTYVMPGILVENISWD